MYISIEAMEKDCIAKNIRLSPHVNYQNQNQYRVKPAIYNVLNTIGKKKIALSKRFILNK